MVSRVPEATEQDSSWIMDSYKPLPTTMYLDRILRLFSRTLWIELSSQPERRCYPWPTLYRESMASNTRTCAFRKLRLRLLLERDYQ